MADASTKRMIQQRQPQRIVSGAAYEEDARIEVSVRPRRLEEYIGQKRVKENIQIAIDAARSRDEALDHVDRKSTRLNSSHRCISYAVFCLKKKNQDKLPHPPNQLLFGQRRPAESG